MLHIKPRIASSMSISSSDKDNLMRMDSLADSDSAVDSARRDIKREQSNAASIGK